MDRWRGGQWKPRVQVHLWASPRCRRALDVEVGTVSLNKQNGDWAVGGDCAAGLGHASSGTQALYAQSRYNEFGGEYTGECTASLGPLAQTQQAPASKWRAGSDELACLRVPCGTRPTLVVRKPPSGLEPRHRVNRLLAHRCTA